MITFKMNLKRNLVFYSVFLLTVLAVSFILRADDDINKPTITPTTTLQDEQDKTAEDSSLPAPSQDNKVTPDSSFEEKRISLSLRNIDIIEALKFFTLKSGFNIVATQKVSGRVSLTVENAPIKDVFDIMLRSNNLAYDKKGEIYNVMSEEEYKRSYGKNFFDTRQVKVFRLKYAIPEQAFSVLDALKSEIGRLLVDPESGSVMLIDTPEKIAEAEKTLGVLEQKSSVKVFNLKYAKAKDIEEQLKNQLDLKKVGMIKADDRSNQVIVQTLPERMENIEALIKSLDKKTKAVLIDTKIIKIRLSNQRDTGIEWEGLFNIAKQYGLAYVGSYPFSVINAGVTSAPFVTRQDWYQSSSQADSQIGSYPSSGTTSNLVGSKIKPGEAMHVGIVDRKRDFDLLIKYLQTLGKSKVIASPSLAVINNQEAKIHIGERRAYVTTTTTTGATTTTIAEEVTYVDTGVRLTVTPTINEDGYVTMKIKPEISSVVGNITTSSKNLVPIIDTNTAETTVIAKDGSTIIIGGLGREEKTEESQGVPFLSSIPFLGFLFRSGTQRTEHVELIIMLTPIIFEGDVFVTTREAEKFRAKPPKKFDVFRPEGPTELPSTPGIFVPIRQDFTPKQTKSYDTITLKPQTEAIRPQEASVPLKEEVTKGLPAKGFKPYELGELVSKR
jgi:type II secretory pathway component GspD/PulD (secretin)